MRRPMPDLGVAGGSRRRRINPIFFRFAPEPDDLGIVGARAMAERQRAAALQYHALTPQLELFARLHLDESSVRALIGHHEFVLAAIDESVVARRHRVFEPDAIIGMPPEVDRGYDDDFPSRMLETQARDAGLMNDRVYAPLHLSMVGAGLPQHFMHRDVFMLAFDRNCGEPARCATVVRRQKHHGFFGGEDLAADGKLFHPRGGIDGIAVNIIAIDEHRAMY